MNPTGAPSLRMNRREQKFTPPSLRSISLSVIEMWASQIVHVVAPHGRGEAEERLENTLPN